MALPSPSRTSLPSSSLLPSLRPTAASSSRTSSRGIYRPSGAPSSRSSLPGLDSPDRVTALRLTADASSRGSTPASIRLRRFSRPGRFAPPRVLWRISATHAHGVWAPGSPHACPTSRRPKTTLSKARGVVTPPASFRPTAASRRPLRASLPLCRPAPCAPKHPRSGSGSLTRPTTRPGYPTACAACCPVSVQPGPPEEGAGPMPDAANRDRSAKGSRVSVAPAGGRRPASTCYRRSGPGHRERALADPLALPTRAPLGFLTVRVCRHSSSPSSLARPRTFEVVQSAVAGHEDSFQTVKEIGRAHV